MSVTVAKPLPLQTMKVLEGVRAEQAATESQRAASGRGTKTNEGPSAAEIAGKLSAALLTGLEMAALEISPRPRLLGPWMFEPKSRS